MKQGGTIANYTGTRLERFIEDTIIQKGYAPIPHKKFKPAQYLGQPIYARKCYLGKSIYETRIFCDFIVYHPKKHPKCLVIESKWQQSKGSVHEKYPYLILNIQYRYPHKTIVVLDGGGYAPGAEKWMRSQVKNNLRAVFNMSQFQTWVNRGNL